MLKKPRGEQVVFGRGGSLMQVGQASWNRLHRWAAEGRPHTAEGSSTLEHTQKQSLGQTVSCSGSSPDRALLMSTRVTTHQCFTIQKVTTMTRIYDK